MDYILFSSLRNSGQELNSLDQELINVVKKGDIKNVQKLVENGADVNCKCYGWSLLCLGSQCGHAEIVHYLLKHKLKELKAAGARDCLCEACYYTDYNENSDTPLICAAREGHVAVCKFLLEAGVCVEQRNQHILQTPLLVAAEQGQTEVCSLLLNFGANVQVTDNVGMTPLYAAIKSRDCRLVQQMIESGCDVNAGSQDHPPIFLAARISSLEIVRMLTDARCQKDVSNKYGVTPLYEATLKGNHQVLQYLIDGCCDVNKPDMYQVTPLHIAAMNGDIRSTDMLVKAGAYLQLQDKQGRTALQVAMVMGRSKVVEYFLKMGMDILKKPMGSSKLTYLAQVFERGHTDTVKVLLRGCSRLPLSHYPGVVKMFSTNCDLLKLLLLSGNYLLSTSLSTLSVIVQNITDPNLQDCFRNLRHCPLTLQDLCRQHVRDCLGNTILCNVKFLPISRSLQQFITMEMV